MRHWIKRLPRPQNCEVIRDTGLTTSDHAMNDQAEADITILKAAET